MTENLGVPYCCPLGAVGVGLSVEICAVPYRGATRFAINFQLGPNVNPRDDVAFHFGVNFGENRITRNSIFNMQWGSPEFDLNNFFSPEIPFKLTVSVNMNNFEVRKHNGPVWIFNHRVSPGSIKFLTIDGDINLLEINHFGVRPGNGSTSYGFNIGPPLNTPSSHMNVPLGSYSPTPSSHFNPPHSQHGYPVHTSSNVLEKCKDLKKKAFGSDKKLYKKGMKYGVPIAGAAVGAYALKKVLGHHHPFKHKHRSSSSSSSSSSDSS